MYDDEHIPAELQTVGQMDIVRGSEQPASTFIERLGAGARLNNTVVALLTKEDHDLPTYREEGWNTYDKLKDSDLLDYSDRFYGIRNGEAFRRREAQIRREISDRKIVDQGHWLERLFVTEGLTSVADWPSLLPGGTIIRSAKGGFAAIRSAATIGTAAAGGTAVQEAALHGLQHTRTLEESAWNVGGSAILGGLVGTGLAGVANRSLRNAARVLERDAELAPARQVFTDIQQKLVDAGATEGEAWHAAVIYAHRYHARARRFDEALGDAWKMYQDQNIVIRRGDDGEFVAVSKAEGRVARDADSIETPAAGRVRSSDEFGQRPTKPPDGTNSVPEATEAAPRAASSFEGDAGASASFHQGTRPDAGRLDDDIARLVSDAGDGGVRIAVSQRGDDGLELKWIEHAGRNPDAERPFLERLSELADEHGKDVRVVVPKDDAVQQRLVGLFESLGYEKARRFNPTGVEMRRSVGKGAAIDASAMPNGLQQLVTAVPGLKRVVHYLLPDELAKLSRRNAWKIVDLFNASNIKEIARRAYAGRAQRDWYRRSAEAIHEIFGEDAPRFTALLAAMSPKIPIEANTLNALNIWANWVKANRPTDGQAIVKIVGASVRGKRGEKSILDAWKNNAVRALSHPDPAALKLSGPKVDSFFANLIGIFEEVTLDAWMAKLFNKPQSLFQGSGHIPGKGLGYIAHAAIMRRTAALLTRWTKETWTPAEAQVAAWSYMRALHKKACREGVSVSDIIKRGGPTDEEIRAVPDFALLFTQDVYRGILERAGYGLEIEAYTRRLAADRRGADGGGKRDGGGHRDGDESRLGEAAGDVRVSVRGRSDAAGAEFDRTGLPEAGLGASGGLGTDGIRGATVHPADARGERAAGDLVGGSAADVRDSQGTGKAGDDPAAAGAEKVTPADTTNPATAEAAQGAASSHQEPTGKPSDTDVGTKTSTKPDGSSEDLYQSGASPRGRITMWPDRNEITLFESADKSTFMHESAHLWFKELITDAAHAKAPQQLKDDLATVLDWLGVKSTDEIGMAQHEKWAEGFERYLAEGKAPNSALATAFEKFRQWLIEIYRSLDHAGVPITDEIRGAMGRMLAADGDPGFSPAAIAARRTNAGWARSPLAMRSGSAAARAVGSQLFDDRLDQKRRFEDVGFDPAAETLMKEWNGRLKRALEGTKDAFTEHWKAAGALDMREFNEAVGRALRNTDDADDPQVVRAAKLWHAQVLGPITDAAVQAGLLPDHVEPAAASSYFSRMWSLSKLFAMEREFKETIAQYYTDRMTREQRAGTAATDVRAKAREIADDLFDVLTGRSDSDARPGERPRLHIPDALAAPFLEDDIELIGRRLIRTVGADLELAQKFGTPDMAQALQAVRAGYEQRRAQTMDEGERHALSRAEQHDIANIEAMRDRIRGTGVEGAVERNYVRIVRAAQHLDAVRAAGEVALPSLSDAVSPAMMQGLSAYMQTVNRLAADLQAVKLPPADAALAGQVATHVLAHRLSKLSDIDDPYASRTPTDAFLQKMTDAHSHWNGVRIFADMQKSFAAVVVQDRILKAARERTHLDGISEDDAAQIAAQFEKHGEEIERVCVPNMRAWGKDEATAAALRAFRAATSKDTGRFISADTPVGEAMLALKNFALASYQRLLLRGLDAKAERFLGGLIAMTAMGMFAAWTASPDVASDAERWIGEGFERSGIMAVPLELSDAFEKATGFDPLGPVKSPQAGTRLLPFNAYPGIRAMLGYALQAHN